MKSVIARGCEAHKRSCSVLSYRHYFLSLDAKTCVAEQVNTYLVLRFLQQLIFTSWWVNYPLMGLRARVSWFGFHQLTNCFKAPYCSLGGDRINQPTRQIITGICIALKTDQS